MPRNQPTCVTLEIKAAAVRQPGWTQVKASNNKVYSYRYSGGNQTSGDGSVAFATAGGCAHVDMELANNAKPRYQIARHGVTILDDPRRQLSVHANSKYRRKIKDKCSAKLRATYKVSVVDTQAGNATIPCDPMIINR